MALSADIVVFGEFGADVEMGGEWAGFVGAFSFYSRTTSATPHRGVRYGGVVVSQSSLHLVRVEQRQFLTSYGLSCRVVERRFLLLLDCMAGLAYRLHAIERSYLKQSRFRL